MTLIELLIFLINCTIGCVLAIRLYAISGSVLLAVVGGIGGFLFGVVCVLALRQVANVWYKFFPLRPPCRRGNCLSDDYVWNAELSQLQKKDVFVCKCGDRYVRNKRRFDELLEDGSIRPFMEHPFLVRSWRSTSSAC